jgi:hypothetical protein
MTAGARLRELLAGDALVVAPGAYDCLTARIVEQAGFPVVYMTGAGTAASLGYPDYGLVTMSEMAANAARIAAAVALPVNPHPHTRNANHLNHDRTEPQNPAPGVAASAGVSDAVLVMAMRSPPWSPSTDGCCPARNVMRGPSGRSA